MNNIFVYIENEGGKVADVCLELLTKGRELATTLGVKLEAVVLGEHLAGIETELAKYGADTVWVADDKIFAPFRTLPHTAVMCGLIEQEKPQIALFGATCNGRDFAPRVSSALYSGLTADCTQLVIGDHKDAKTGKEYKDLLYQIRPAFGGNIIATIVNPDNRPQMATVREGVMRREYAAVPGAGEVKKIDWQKFVKDTDLAVRILDREISESKIDIKGASVIVAGGYGMGSKENFELVFELADVLGAEVGASRAAVDAAGREAFVAGDMGPCGQFVRPLGDLHPLELYEALREQARGLVEGGVDLFLIETQFDLAEVRIAVAAIRAESDLPIMVSMTFEQGTSLTGTTPEIFAETMQNLGVDALGLNCGLGPEQMAPLMERFLACSSVPVLAEPNAGLPELVDGKTVFRLPPEPFAEKTAAFVGMGLPCGPSTGEAIRLPPGAPMFTLICIMG